MIKHWSKLVAFISLASSTIAAGQVSTPPLIGLVTDSSGRPLRKAGVALLGTSIAVHSDSAGRYVFLDVPSGVYTVRATAIGYVRVDRTNVRVRAGGTTHLDFALGYNNCDLACGAVIVTTPKDSRAPFVDSLSKMQVIPLHDGPNDVDLNADGKTDLVWLAWRDNGNAHGFDIFTFYVSNPTRYYSDRPWLIVPVYDSVGEQEQDSYRTSMGADCILEDLRLLRSKTDPRAPVVLLSGAREFGETYADAMPVTFVVYRLVYDSMAVGGPPFYFQATRTIRSRAKYCDVNEAFEQELGLGPYRNRN